MEDENMLNIFTCSLQNLETFNSCLKCIKKIQHLIPISDMSSLNYCIHNIHQVVIKFTIRFWEVTGRLGCKTELLVINQHQIIIKLSPFIIINICRHSRRHFRRLLRLLILIWWCIVVCKPIKHKSATKLILNAKVMSEILHKILNHFPIYFVAKVHFVAVHRGNVILQVVLHTCNWRKASNMTLSPALWRSSYQLLFKINPEPTLQDVTFDLHC